MCTAKEYDRALLDPSAVFKLPKDVLNSDALTTEQKLELLKRHRGSRTCATPSIR